MILVDFETEAGTKVIHDVLYKTLIYQKHVPYYNLLVSVREFLEKQVKNFPAQSCDLSTHFLHSAFKEYHFSFKEFECTDYDYTTWVHVCSYDAQRKLYIDLTLDQFVLGEGNVDLKFPSIALVPDMLELGFFGKRRIRSGYDYSFNDAFSEQRLLELDIPQLLVEFGKCGVGQ